MHRSTTNLWKIILNYRSTGSAVDFSRCCVFATNQRHWRRGNSRLTSSIDVATYDQIHQSSPYYLLYFSSENLSSSCHSIKDKSKQGEGRHEVNKTRAFLRNWIAHIFLCCVSNTIHGIMDYVMNISAFSPRDFKWHLFSACLLSISTLEKMKQLALRFETRKSSYWIVKSWKQKDRTKYHLSGAAADLTWFKFPRKIIRKIYCHPLSTKFHSEASKVPLPHRSAKFVKSTPALRVP